MIRMSHVTKTYGEIEPALSDINLEIKKGEFVFLTGASGAGKTTLLKLLFCEERGDHGELFINDRNIFTLKEREIPYLRRTIGFVFQDFKLIHRKTVFENTALPMEIVGASRKEIKKRVQEVLEMVQLLGHERKLPDAISAGEQQRVAIARAMVNHPLLLLADEPTGNLDEMLSLEILELLKNINAFGTTVVVATHQRHAISQIASRMVTLLHGKIVSNGKSE
ncbi:MAG: cell division ATP-binding protein FtsE [Nitrospirae bacterium]|nr:cell division ATP-binding protein FtsE [Candidatus Troglogloeales bacterium]MBI3598484.1 cell division ATP-binding protein FtsE [Candidatus Troglogloeales bacterium]